MEPSLCICQNKLASLEATLVSLVLPPTKGQPGPCDDNESDIYESDDTRSKVAFRVANDNPGGRLFTLRSFLIAWHLVPIIGHHWGHSHFQTGHYHPLWIEIGWYWQKIVVKYLLTPLDVTYAGFYKMLPAVNGGSSPSDAPGGFAFSPSTATYQRGLDRLIFCR